MKYYELTCKTYLKQDLDFKLAFERLAKYINYALVQSGLKHLHTSKSAKHYVFSGFKSKEGFYKTSEILEFSIRALDENLVDALSKSLRENVNNPFLQALDIKKKEVKQYFIKEFFSLTPVIVSTENGRFWTKQERVGKEFLKFELENNLKKKYESFYNEKLKIEEDFISEFEQKNNKPQNIQIIKNDKIIRFFGNKFRIVPHADEASQKLAFIALACGLGEKNSYGAGFCLGK